MVGDDTYINVIQRGNQSAYGGGSRSPYASGDSKW